MTIWKKVNKIIIKKCNSEAIYNKKNLKAEKRFNSKKSFQCFYITVILFDSVHRKDGSCYLEVLLEKQFNNLFLENYKKSWFLELWMFLLKYKHFLGVSVFRNIRKAFFWDKTRNFLGEFLFPKIQRSCISRNIRKAFFWENIRIFLILELERFISRKYKKHF